MDNLNVLLAALAGLGAAAVVGAVKKVEAAVDAKLVSRLGNLTPILVTLLAIGLPKLATILHLSAVPDAQAFASAPLATIIAVAARELYVKVFHQAPPAPPV